MDHFIQHTNQIHQIKIPLPFPLRWVNSYLIKGSGGYTLIDPGIHTEEAEAYWHEAMKHLHITFADIEKVVLTHHHPDHYGISGWIQKQAEVPVYMSELSYQQAVRLWGEGQTLTDEMYWLYLRHGLEQRLAAAMIPHMDSFIPLVSPKPQVTFIREGDSVELGDLKYSAILTPGHALGHLCFYQEDRRIMFCGDQVIPQISPNVSYFPDSDPNPLLSFLDSLKQLAAYKVELAYPGHRDPFPAYEARIYEIIQHHNQRLQRIMSFLASSLHPLTTYDLCVLLFGSKLPIHQLRFAMSETLAHMVYLVLSEQAVEKEHNGIVLYQPIGFIKDS